MAPMASRALGYLGTGGVAAVVDIGGFAALHGLGFGVIASGIGSFLVAALFNYVLSSLLVFRTALGLGRFAAFLAGASVGLVVNTGVTALAANFLPIPAVAAKVLGIGIAFFFNFLLNALVVFRKKEGMAECNVAV